MSVRFRDSPFSSSQSISYSYSLPDPPKSRSPTRLLLSRAPSLPAAPRPKQPKNISFQKVKSKSRNPSEDVLALAQTASDLQAELDLLRVTQARELKAVHRQFRANSELERRREEDRVRRVQQEVDKLGVSKMKLVEAVERGEGCLGTIVSENGAREAELIERNRELLEAVRARERELEEVEREGDRRLKKLGEKLEEQEKGRKREMEEGTKKLEEEVSKKNEEIQLLEEEWRIELDKVRKLVDT